ncbi:divalent metal cation transporter, partial [Candidatus Latescibacterota bacterium]
IPMVIFTLDSASRIGIISGGRGMLDMIKTEIFPALAWIIFIPQFLLNIVVNISQMSVMTEAVYGVFGIDLPPGGAVTPLKILIVLVLISIIVYAVVIGSYKRLQKVMTGLLMIILFCFIVVAVKGLMQWSTWTGILGGLVPNIPADIPVRGSDEMRRGFTQLMSIAGQALPAAVFLSYGYFTSNADYTENDLKKNFNKSVLNFGVIWGLFSVMVVVAGVTALHNVYTGAGGGLHYSQISTIPEAGKVIAPALPGFIDFIATPIFSLGLLVAAFTTMVAVALIMVYFCLDVVGKDWKLREGNKAFQWTLAFWIIIPGLLSPFWHLDALIQAILAMAGNLVMAPLAVLIIMYFINKEKYMGKHTASAGRNVVLGITFIFSIYVVIRGILNFWNQYFS